MALILPVFVVYWEKNNILLYCLPAHSTHLLQPLDVKLAFPLQHHYSKAVDNCVLTTDIAIIRDTFFPLFKQARQEAFTNKNIQPAFATCRIVPLRSKVVMEKLQAPGTQSCLMNRNHITLK